jgi:hypothetical protein
MLAMLEPYDHCWGVWWMVWYWTIVDEQLMEDFLDEVWMGAVA